jgi:hypothetical protein
MMTNAKSNNANAYAVLVAAVVEDSEFGGSAVSRTGTVFAAIAS